MSDVKRITRDELWAMQDETAYTTEEFLPVAARELGCLQNAKKAIKLAAEKAYGANVTMTALNERNRMLMGRWLGRGDGVAVFENAEIGSMASGHRQFVSYGSKAAQIELSEPPERMPDIGHSINHSYRLVAVCREAPCQTSPT